MVTVSTEVEIRNIGILLTGDPKREADGTPDHYFCSFYTLDQVAYVNDMTRKYPSLHAAIVTMKAAAGSRFKAYLTELICINHFESEGIADAATVAQAQLRDRKVRTVICPITSANVCVFTHQSGQFTY